MREFYGKPARDSETLRLIPITTSRLGMGQEKGNVIGNWRD